MVREKIDFIGKVVNINLKKVNIIISKGVDIGGFELFIFVG